MNAISNLPSGTTAIRGSALSFSANPFIDGGETSTVYEPDALIILREGKISAVGDYAATRHLLPEGAPVATYPDALILPGFIDTHVHYPQTGIIGAYGSQLLDWLDTYTFPAEQRFASEAHGVETATQFLRECVRAGTTTAMVYCTVHPQSVDAFFGVAEKINARMIAGKVLMDRHAPEVLLDTPQSGYDQSKALLRRWHTRGRQLYCITPRFAPSSSPQQLEMAGALWQEFPDAYLQSHVSETRDEVAWAGQLFPERNGYLDIYAHYGLLGPRAVYGHGVHLTDSELARCHASGTAIAHCPTSNLFLGSGCLNVHRLQHASRPVRVGLASDIGAGTSFSALQTMNEAYKAAQSHGNALSAWQAFYLATRGAAHALYLDDRIGSIAPGYEADLVVLDLKSTALIAYRMQFCRSLEEALFVQMTLGDDRATRATYIAGQLVYDRDRSDTHTF